MAAPLPPLAAPRTPPPADEALEAFVVKIVADRLRQERSFAERRHASLCEALRRDLDAASWRVIPPSFGSGAQTFSELCREDSETTFGELLRMSAPLPSVGEPEDELPGDLELEEERKTEPAEAAADTPVANVCIYPDEIVEVGASPPPPSRPSAASLEQDAPLAPGVVPRSVSIVAGMMPKPNLQKTMTASRLASSADPTTGKPLLERIVMGSQFELFFGMLILSNAAIMALEVQYDGMHNEKTIGFMNASTDTPVEGWPSARLSFRVLDWFFGLIFASEVVLKGIAMQGGFFLSCWNYFDTLIVAVWFLASLATLGFAMNPLVLRAFRFARLLRLVRLMKMTSWFDTLVLMVSSIQASVFVLLWGVVLLVLAMTLCALMLNSMLVPFMLNEDEPEHIRHEVFKYLGTYSRCMVTMFEITLGNWVPLCRLLGDHVNEGLAIFFLVYRCVVGFAVMNVIKGVFLHETFRCAGLDDDLMVLHRRRMRAKFKDKMLQFFAEADTSNDDKITVDEFCDMIGDERVNTWLEAMDLRVRDVGAERVFAFLAGGDMILSRAELCTGMSRLRGAAQGLDVISILGLTAPDIAEQLPVPADVKRLRNDLPRHSHVNDILPRYSHDQEKAPPSGMSFFPV